MSDEPTTAVGADRARLTPDEYSRRLLQAYALAHVLRALPIAPMLRMIQQAHALAPIADPTLYRANLDKLRQDEQLLGILHGAKRELDALPWPAAAGVPG